MQNKKYRVDLQVSGQCACTIFTILLRVSYLECVWDVSVGDKTKHTAIPQTLHKNKRLAIGMLGWFDAGFVC